MIAGGSGSTLPKNPRRPVMKHDEYLQLLKVADRVHPLFKVALIVAEGTGRRLSAWRNLFWDDVDIEAGTISWRAEYDKKGHEHVVPMSLAVKGALAGARRGRLPDRRVNPKGRIRVRRRDLLKLAGANPGSYDATADAQSIAQLRRTL